MPSLLTPVVVFTVYRRFFELSRALDRLEELAGEFASPPKVVVVWACPEIGHLWFFQQLVREQKVDAVLTRQRLSGERPDGPTTYPESHNIRLGLEHVRRTYDRAYAIVQAADIYPQNNSYSIVDKAMQNGDGAVLFHWPNGCVPREIWHTNFFAVKPDEVYWPPVVDIDEQDCLEWAWGKALLEKNPSRVIKTHNYNEKRFLHQHLSEQQPPWPFIPLREQGSLTLCLTGHMTFLDKLWAGVVALREFFRRVTWPKSSSSSTPIPS